MITPLADVTELFHHQWNVPIIAEMHAAPHGARFVVLLSELGTSRDALATSLNALRDAGFVTKNPGYGHPLRPEYRLTAAGRRMGPACEGYRRVAKRGRLEGVAYRKWTAPLLVTLGEGCERFSAIRSARGTITSRSLAQALKALVDAGLVDRRVDEGYPPHTSYVLTRRGRSLAREAAGIAAASPRIRHR